jgi:hypothetical protein
MVVKRRDLDVTPSARRLTTSLRDIGYGFVSAVADVVDNSISAFARRVDIELVFEGSQSYVLIADDGIGMTNAELSEALRFGTRRDYLENELGRYGLGLKTASLSQCKRLTVITRKALVRRRLNARMLDLDHIVDTDSWTLRDVPDSSIAYRALEWLESDTGTVLVWENLDRILPDNPDSGWARRRFDNLARSLEVHLGMVFHRFIEGATVEYDRLTITVNGRKVPAWNPFAPREEFRVVLPVRQYEVWTGDRVGAITLRPAVLPARTLFSSTTEFERLSGPEKWNRQQGLYIYRGDRMVKSGGWCGIRAIDEHTKLARTALDFSPELDELFRINVAKTRVSLPAEIRALIEPQINELCHRAQEMYRRDLREGLQDREHPSASKSDGTELVSAGAIGAAFLAAALATKTVKALDAMSSHMRRISPEVVRQLGW